MIVPAEIERFICGEHVRAGRAFESLKPTDFR